MLATAVFYILISEWDEIDSRWVKTEAGEKFGYTLDRNELYAAVSKEIGLSFTIPAYSITKVTPEGEKKYSICEILTFAPEKYLSVSAK